MTDKMLQDFENIAQIFKQLGDPTRLRIFWTLCHTEACVTQLATSLSMSSPAISHHLRPLRSSGLITAKRNGKEVFYKASENEESHLLHAMIEEVMKVTCPGIREHDEYMASQIEIIHNVHDYLAEHISERITIEDLSKRFLMNQTTLKNLFKSVYGESIAAHMKEHRMKQAAIYLTQTQKSVCEIAHSVGYDSQSRFTNAFKEYYHILPKEYRRSNPYS